MHIFQLSFFLLLFHSLSQAQQLYNEYYYSNCSVADYTANTTFETNLNSLLPILTFNARFVSYFYTERGANPDTIYGLFLCRGDVTFNTCNACVNQSTQDIKQRCPNRKQAVIWYDHCMLRYSDRNFKSVYDPSINSLMLTRSSKNTSDPQPFNQTLNSLMRNLSSVAAFSPSVRMLAMGEANFTASQKIYAIAQCTPDLSENDCNTCLLAAISEIPVCCDGRDGAVISGASCAMRYEVFPFYAGAASVPRPPPSSPTDSSSEWICHRHIYGTARSFQPLELHVAGAQAIGFVTGISMGPHVASNHLNFKNILGPHVASSEVNCTNANGTVPC